MKNPDFKIHILYNFQKGPWGGGNQFLKALKGEFEKREIHGENLELANCILFNSYQNLSETVKLKIKYPDKRFIHRLGPIFHLHRGRAWKIIDKLVIKVSNKIADAVIFQSQWSFDENVKLGFNKDKIYCIINNACEEKIFNKNSKAKFDKDKKIRLIASSWSANWNKGFDIYKYLDENLDFAKYEMTFIGNSPIKFKNIKHIKPLPSKKLAKELKKHDIFISGVKDDACSNSVLEALACGLPVIALNSGGNAEIIKSGGKLFDKKEEVIEKIELMIKNYFKYQNSIKLKSIKQVANEYLRAAPKGRTVRRASLFFYYKIISIEFLFRIYNKFYNKIKNTL